MTLSQEEIQLLRLLIDMAGKLPEPEESQVSKLLAKVELFILSANLGGVREQRRNI